MKNLELMQNKNGGYGIYDLDSKRVVIPCMYEKKQLEHIVNIIPLSNFWVGYDSNIYVLVGYDLDNNEVYGLYNSMTNDFIEVMYYKLALALDENNKPIENTIKFIKGNDIKICNVSVSQDNKSVNPKIKIFSNDNKTYGLATSNGEEIIPQKYTRREIFNIGDIVEILERIYILIDKDDSNKIVGFYDRARDILKKGLFTGYEIVADVLVLRNRVENKEERPTRESDREISKSYISIYDPKNGKYITGDFYDREISEYESDGYRYSAYVTREIKGLSEINGVILLNSKAFYDTRTGYLVDNIVCYENDGNVELVDSLTQRYLGYYDVNQRIVKEYKPIICDGLGEYTRKSLYLSKLDNRLVHFGNKDYRVIEYTDFLCISEDGFTILFDKEYNFLAYSNRQINITEIRPVTVEQLGIPIEHNKAAYMIKNKLYTFKRINKKLIPETRLPNHFVKISAKVIGAIQYEYGIGSIETESAAELDYKLDQLSGDEQRIAAALENFFYEDENLMQEYPSLVRKKK